MSDLLPGKPTESKEPSPPHNSHSRNGLAVTRLQHWVAFCIVEPTRWHNPVAPCPRPRGVAVIFITGRPDKHRDGTVLNFVHERFEGWTELRTRPDRDDLPQCADLQDGGTDQGRGLRHHCQCRRPESLSAAAMAASGFAPSAFCVYHCNSSIYLPQIE